MNALQVDPAYQRLSEGIEGLRVIERCGCGCESVDFRVHDPERPAKPIASGIGRTHSGAEVGVIIWGTVETVTGIEVYSLGEWWDDIRLSVPQSILPWPQNKST